MIVVTIDKNASFIDHKFGIRLPDGCKLAIIWKKENDVTIYWHDFITEFFWHWCVPLVMFSYSSKFHVNIIIGSGVMTIFVYKGLTKNPEIGNTPVWVLPKIWRLGWVRNTKFGTNVSDKKVLITAKCQGYNFCCFWVTKGKPGGVKFQGKVTGVLLEINFDDASCTDLPFSLWNSGN